VSKNFVFGVLVYAPAAALTLSALYAVEPDAIDLIVIKKLVFGESLYAPAASCASVARYAVEPDA
jgi:hypothetical protein